MINPTSAVQQKVKEYLGVIASEKVMKIVENRSLSSEEKRSWFKGLIQESLDGGKLKGVQARELLSFDISLEVLEGTLEENPEEKTDQYVDENKYTRGQRIVIEMVKSTPNVDYSKKKRFLKKLAEVLDILIDEEDYTEKEALKALEHPLISASINSHSAEEVVSLVKKLSIFKRK